MSVISSLKCEYNQNLERYYNGCKYLEKHRDEIDKWTPELMNILDALNATLDEIKKYKNIDKDEILNGFILED